MVKFDLVFFDCDSTLSAIEGIDELAKRVGKDVSELTNAAMNGELPMEEVYRLRLESISPSKADFSWLGEEYIKHEVPNAKSVIKKLNENGVETHIISGGLLPAIIPFAKHLGIPNHQVHAVPYKPNNLEETWAHPLARNGGKPKVIEQIILDKSCNPKRCALIGDGISDFEAAKMIGTFIGFGGVITRNSVKDQTKQYIQANTLEPLLDVVLD